MRLVVKHRGGDVHRVADEVLADDDHREAGRRHVLLRAGIQHREAAHVDGLAQDAGGDVRHQGHVARLGQLRVARAVDRVVHADVEVIRVLREGCGVQIRNVGEGLILRGSHHVGLAVAGSLLVSLGGPLARQHEVGLAALRHQVHRDHRKLRGSASLQEQNLVIVRNPHHFPQKTFRGVNDALVFLGAMRHFHDGLAAAVIIQPFVGCAAQHRLRQHRGAGGKIINAIH